MIVHPQSELIREPGLLVPKSKPVGRVVINHDAPIKKDVLIPVQTNLDGWTNGSDGARPTFLRDIAGKGAYGEIENSEVDGLHHLHWHPQGIKNSYGGDYNDAEGFFVRNMPASAIATGTGVTMGVVWEPYQVPSLIISYTLFAGGASDATGHQTSPYTGISLTSSTTIRVSYGNKSYSYTVPDMYSPLKQHVTIMRAWKTATTNYVQLIHDGVIYAEQDAGNGTALSSEWAFMIPYSGHHNRVCDAVGKLFWYADYKALLGACVKECNDPWIAVVPA